ncbi:MAG: hypothetical protein OHK0039_25190 [Bacteroidia bacterium]
MKTALLIGVLLLALGLRLYRWQDRSLGNDDLSALSRTLVDSPGELIARGVVPDGHPAGVQVLLYAWSRCVGYDETLLRLPFLLASLLSILLAYRLGQLWFGASSGLLLAVVLACSEYSLLHSLSLRPYPIGQLCALGLALGWSRLLFGEKTGWQPLVAPLLWGAALAYTHYFGLLLLGLVMLSGLALVRRHTWRPYLLALLGQVLLYLPHLPVFRAQLQTGGIGGWLAPPQPTFLTDFVAYQLHYAWAAGLAVLLVIAGSWVAAPVARTRAAWRYRLLALLWFGGSLAAGYAYSVLRQPVLHFAVLYFATPFAWLFVFSWVGESADLVRGLARWLPAIRVVVLALALAYTLVAVRGYYRLYHDGGAKALVQHGRAWEARLGQDQVAWAMQVHHPFYLDYYRTDAAQPCDWYSLPDYRTFEAWLAAESRPVVVTGWLSKPLPLEYLALIRRYYPFEVETSRWPISELYAFARTPLPPVGQPAAPYFASSPGDTYWTGPPDTTLDATVAFGPTFAARLDLLARSRHDVIEVAVSVRRLSAAVPALVLSIEQEGQVVGYRRVGFDAFVAAGDSGWVFLAERLRHFPIDLHTPLHVKAYVWNPDGATARIGDLALTLRPGNPAIYAFAEAVDE